MPARRVESPPALNWLDGMSIERRMRLFGLLDKLTAVDEPLEAEAREQAQQEGTNEDQEVRQAAETRTDNET